MLNFIFVFLFNFAVAVIIANIIFSFLLKKLKIEVESSIASKNAKADEYFHKFIDMSEHAKAVTFCLINVLDYLPEPEKEKSLNTLRKFDEYVKDKKEKLESEINLEK
jgi:hypothetical protein